MRGDELRTYTSGKSTTCTDEETSTNGTTNGNHVQVTRLHGTFKFDDTRTIVLLSERAESETVTNPPILLPRHLTHVSWDNVRGASGSGVNVVGKTIGLLLITGRAGLFVSRHDEGSVLPLLSYEGEFKEHKMNEVRMERRKPRGRKTEVLGGEAGLLKIAIPLSRHPMVAREPGSSITSTVTAGAISYYQGSFNWIYSKTGFCGILGRAVRVGGVWWRDNLCMNMDQE